MVRKILNWCDEKSEGLDVYDKLLLSKTQKN